MARWCGLRLFLVRLTMRNSLVKWMSSARLPLYRSLRLRLGISATERLQALSPIQIQGLEEVVFCHLHPLIHSILMINWWWTVLKSWWTVLSKRLLWRCRSLRGGVEWWNQAVDLQVGLFHFLCIYRGRIRVGIQLAVVWLAVHDGGWGSWRLFSDFWRSIKIVLKQECFRNRNWFCLFCQICPFRLLMFDN